MKFLDIQKILKHQFLMSPWIFGMIDKAIGFSRMNTFLTKCFAHDGKIFLKQVIECLNINVKVDSQGVIPKSGACVAIANHPHGLLDGVLLLSLVLDVRRDVKILVNESLYNFNIFREFFLFVNPYHSNSLRNRAALKTAMAFLRSGGILIVFPAGDVSCYQWRLNKVTDSPWDVTCVKFLRAQSCPIVPIKIAGHNSSTYLVAKFIHVKLGLAMMIREFLRTRNSTINITVGKTLSPSDFPDEPDNFYKYLRYKVYSL